MTRAVAFAVAAGVTTGLWVLVVSMIDPGLAAIASLAALMAIGAP